jgi:hypothetical protein
MRREGRCTVLRQGYRLVILLAALIVAVLYLSPAYARGVPHDTAGQDFVSVKAGTPVTVLGLHHEPANPSCHPATLYACQAHTYALVQLPNGKVVALDHKAVNFQTHTIRVSGGAFGPLPPKVGNRDLGLSDTGGVARLPLVGAVVLIGSVLLLRRMLHQNRVG